MLDDCISGDRHYTVTRDMRVLEIAEDGSKVKLWVSAAMQADNDTVWHPKYLYKKVVENIGYCPPDSNMGSCDLQIMEDVMIPCWDRAAEWTADALDYLIQEEDYEMVFTQFHNVDALGHMFLRHLIDRHEGRLEPEVYERIMEQGYVQTDNYIGRFEHYIDEGWTVIFISDHAQTAQEHDGHDLFDGSGISVKAMEELGYTVLKRDENGKRIREI